MSPFKKILVALDFSVHSDRAVEVAADLSRRYLASVTLAHVFHPSTAALPGGLILPESSADAMYAHFRSELQSQIARARAAGALDVETRMATGFPVTELCAMAEDGPFDLLVMGTHGRTGLNRVLMGSVAEHVTRLSPCPVLTVRA